MKEKEELVVLAGNRAPFGATVQTDGVNFSLYSPYITDVKLHIFQNEEDSYPIKSFNLEPNINKSDDVWHIKVLGLKEGAYYLFSAKGMDFDESYILEPYFKLLTSHSIFLSEQLIEKQLKGKEKILTASRFPKCVVVNDDNFKWKNDKKPNIPLSECVIYESHVKGISINADIPHDVCGTYMGITYLIPYLKKLKVTTIELMPVFEFDENEIDRFSADGVSKLKNYWGYSPLSFFAPKATYAKNAKNAVNEFKEMVRILHTEKIEVILDVVFNHTAEGGNDGYKFSFKALAENEYYLLDSKGMHQNYSGCGNTFNVASEASQKIILDSLCYWVSVMHVDGFRFDLASIFMREGEKLNTYSKLLQKIKDCPLLQGIKLIAEPWDAYDAYNLGSFPCEWLEWNDKYRDTFRRFWLQKENAPKAKDILDSLRGSPNIFNREINKATDLNKRQEFKIRSINFITCHDGFTMADLVSYNTKHNKDNMEENRDGSNCNFSFNHGVEGNTENKKNISIRHLQIKNMMASLFFSSGIPMLLMGDEVMRSQKGNNNAYCQDNEISYFDWGMLQKNKWLFEYVAMLNSLRREIKLFSLLAEKDIAFIECFDEIGAKMEMNRECSFLSIFIKSNKSSEKDYFIILNSLEYDVTITLPKPKNFRRWHCLLDTYYTASSNEDSSFFDYIHYEKCIYNDIYISLSHSVSIFASY